MNENGYRLLTSMILALGGAVSGYADAFHGTSFMGENGTEMVGMGYAGNSVDPALGTRYPLGDVSYQYRIGKTEVSSSQFSTSGVSGGDGSNDNSPVVEVSLYQARMYANWLTIQTNGEGALLAYSADGETIINTRAVLVESGELVYVIPTETEWYKAAYYDGANDSYSYFTDGCGIDEDYRPSTDLFNYDDAYGFAMDVGFSEIEQNGTQDMAGNVWEMIDSPKEWFSMFGGAYDSIYQHIRASNTWRNPSDYSSDTIGFRVAAIPEPASMALIGLFGGGILFVRRIFMM